MPSKKQVYRLFKVAKELNVGTSLLVEHLQQNGHDVAPSPNTKLNSDQYDILLKEFASEKLIKERADQLAEERRREEAIQQATNEVAKPTAEAEESNLTAADLRNQIKAPVTPETAPPPPVEKEKAPVEMKAVPTPTPEPVAPETTQQPTPPAEKKASSGAPSGLKVLGHVDIKGYTKKGKKTEPEAKAPVKKAPKVSEPEKKAKAEPAPVKPEPKKEEPKQEEVRKPEPPKPKVPEAKEEVKTPAKPEEQKPVEPKVKAPVEDKKKASTPPAESSKVEEKPQPEEKAVGEEGKEKEENTLYRAEDRAPKLSGLKVMGKIELPGDKKKKKKEEEAPSTDNKGKPGEGNGEGEDGAKKRRRRRRKRKRKPGTEVASDNKQSNQSGGGGGGRTKKEKPSAKEVDQSIKETLSQIGRGASRKRQSIRRQKRDLAEKRREALEAQAAENAQVLELTEFITANEFANLISVPVTQIITKSFELGMMVSINQRLDAELLTLLAGDYGYTINFVDITEEGLDVEEEEDDPDRMVGRNPIITVMGHVDHGKTTLLDRLRQENVAAGEAGGITQHIGAYTVELESGKAVTFLDTPGHEAFTAMRARGAKVTDVVIIVIAADDAVMPQTKEAISHAQAAEVPMVFAFNKIDKAGADAERIKGQLAEMNLLVEDWGGKYQSQEISALKGQGVEDLLEKVIFEADVLELQADPERSAVGTVIEARLDKGRGNVATMLVQKGTLSVGDDLVAGIHYGRVRALIDQNGQRIKVAGPSTPVQVLGINGQPTAGDKFYVFEDDGKAKEISQRRTELYREQQMRNTNRLTLEEIGRRRALGNFKELNVIIRGDVDGSVEALSGSLLNLSTEEVQVNILQKGVGAITEADINLAIASEAIVIAFNVRPIAKARQLADRENVDISTYSVIYDAIDDVRDALEGLLSPELREEEAGTAEIREVFKISKVGNIAGCLVVSGKIERGNPVRIIRDGVVVHEGKLASLKRFKDDAKEVVSGQECGMMIDNFNDIQVGDTIESYRVNEIRRKLKK